MRVCIQCLGCYNEGKLNFKWYNRDELRENLDDLNPCKRADHEEYMMADMDYYAKRFGEYPDYEKVLEFMDLIDEYGEPFEIWVCYAGDIDHLEKHEIEEKFIDEYVGEYSEREYAEEYLEYDLKDLNPLIACNINYEGVWIDLKHNGYYSQNTGFPNYTNYIFRS